MIDYQNMPQNMPLEMDLCQLLDSMKIVEQQAKQDASKDHQVPLSPTSDISMCEDLSSQSDAESESSNTNPSSSTAGLYGCAYLQAIQAQMDSFPEAGSVYLDTIFTHREVFLAYPQAHPECSRGFSDMAYALEQRAWREEREAANDAVAAFRHEAWVIAMSLRDVSSKEILQDGAARGMRPSSSACHLMSPM
ncbi:hypothetical protein HGRIS_002082 [Hohenbuehelia grisea]|uniref:Uncharacterized protein n=1 Tax=Hohenbuehelia grisea TaxID=104357 RepID=A0ABR3JJU2_9AGAR